MEERFQVRAVSEIVVPVEMMDSIISKHETGDGMLDDAINLKPQEGKLTYDFTGNRLKVVYDFVGESREDSFERGLKTVSDISVFILSGVLKTFQKNIKYPSIKGIWIEWIKPSGHE